MPLRYHSAASAAEVLDVSRQTIFRLIKAGVLPAKDIAPVGARQRRYRISEDDLQKYVDSLPPAPLDQATA